MHATTRAAARPLGPTSRQRAEATLSVVTPLAWALLLVAVPTLVAGRRLGWVELTVVASTALVVLVASVGFTMGRADLAVAVEVRPNRVPAGDRAAAAIVVGRASGGRMLGVDMELTVGEGVAEFRVPTLASGTTHEEIFILPTHRRAVIPVGPATSVRSDPFGLLRRIEAWTEPEPLFVHPRTVALTELGSGFVRDLEGKTTNNVSQADVAFNTMREYQPGDDRRFVHWLTTARVGRLMVRQFIDTRRSHVGLVVDGTRTSYGDDEEFETAVSVAASLGVRVLREEQDLSMVVGRERVPTTAANVMLDHLAAVEARRLGSGLRGEVDQLVRMTGGLSLALLVTGSHAAVADLRAAAVRLPEDVRVLILRVDPEGETGFRPLGSDVLLTLDHLDELTRLLWTVAS